MVMKIKLLNLTYFIACIIFIDVTANNVLAQSNEIDPMLQVEKDNCQGTTEDKLSLTKTNFS